MALLTASRFGIWVQRLKQFFSLPSGSFLFTESKHDIIMKFIRSFCFLFLSFVCQHLWNKPRLLPCQRGGCTHLGAAVPGIHPQVEAGAARQSQDVLQHVAAEVLDAALQHEVADEGVLLGAVVAEVDEVLDVVAGAHVLDVLTERRHNTSHRPHRLYMFSRSHTSMN